MQLANSTRHKRAQIESLFAILIGPDIRSVLLRRHRKHMPAVASGHKIEIVCRCWCNHRLDGRDTRACKRGWAASQDTGTCCRATAPSGTPPAAPATSTIDQLLVDIPSHTARWDRRSVTYPSLTWLNIDARHDRPWRFFRRGVLVFHNRRHRQQLVQRLSPCLPLRDQLLIITFCKIIQHAPNQGPPALPACG